MSTATKNGAPRKQLSEQLDRLDGVIDALDEGLKGAVSDAVRDAVGAAVSEAVQAVLLELMTNPELQKAVRQASAPAGPPAIKKDEEDQQPEASSGSLLSRAWGRVRSCAAAAGAAFSAARLAWRVCGNKTKSLALAAGAAAAGAAYAARARIASAAAAACGAAKYQLANAGRRLGRLAPALAN